MKVSRIVVSNVAGISHADLAITKPVVFVAGGNGAGKTTLVQCIRMALNGELPRDLIHKKQLSMAVRDGQKKGAATVETDSGTNNYQLPTGKLLSGIDFGQGAEFAALTLQMQAFTAMKDADRKTMLSKLMKIRVNGAGVRDRLRKRGINESYLEEAAVMISGGFPAATVAAEARISELRSEWRVITGGPWGTEKGEDWKADKPSYDESALAQTEAMFAESQAKLTTAKNELVAKSAQADQGRALLERQAELQGRVDGMEDIASKLAQAKDDLAKSKAEYDEVAQRAGDISITRYTCPCCTKQLVVNDGQLVEVEPADADAITELPSYRKAVFLFEGVVSRLQAEHDACIAARDALQAMGEQSSIPTDADLDQLRATIADLQDDVDLLINSLQAMRDDRDKAMNADAATEKATETHKKILDWMQIHEAVCPNGIPSDLLLETIAPFNETLARLAGIASWVPPAIGNDLAIHRNGRPYVLLSKSEKWRCDALLTLAVAIHGQTGIALIDEVDILELPARGEFFDLVEAIGHEVGTIIAVGTLKAPVGESELMHSFWAEGAEIHLRDE